MTQLHTVKTMTTTVDPALTDKVQREAYLRLARDAAVEQVRFYRLCALSAILGKSHSQVALDSSPIPKDATENKSVELTNSVHLKAVVASS